MGSPEPKEFWAQVQDNHNKLEGCVGPHDFVVRLGPEPYVNSHFACLKCRGEVSWDIQHWYRLGLRHGGRSA